MKIEYKMDEGTLKTKLVETNVLATKDHTRWNWELISDLVEGPLTNPQLLTLTLKSTKFLKRILSFLRPSRKEFSAMSRDKRNMKYVRIGCQALETLTQTELGTSFLRDNELVAQIGDYLQLETQASDKKKAHERLFSSEKVLKTMAREYFTMLGTLSSSDRGLDVLRKYKIFEMLAPLSSMQGRDDLSHLIMTSLDYNITGPSRILLSKSLTSTSRVVRYLATRHLRVLLRSGVNGFPEWGVKLLVRQLGGT
jgi:rapamycin-insensitive companion of mTOR